MIWIILTMLGIYILAVVSFSTFAVGLQEAADPNHSKSENLSHLEKSIVNRGDVNSSSRTSH